MADFHVKTTRHYTEHDLELCFEWWGGAYIEVSPVGGTAREVINVWDYERDEPRYARTAEAFQMAIDSWVQSYGIENLVHDVRENWG